MGSCQNKNGIIIKSNRRDMNEKDQLKDEKYHIDPRFEDMPEWPSNIINLNFFIK